MRKKCITNAGKRVITVCSVLLTVCCLSYSQVSIFDKETDKKWHVLAAGIAALGDMCCIETEIFKTGITDTIDDTEYLTIWYTQDIHEENWDLYGYTREDNLKVYFRPFLETNDFLLYDFNVEVDSVIYITNPMFGNTDSIGYTITCIDSVELDNQKRKRIFLTDGSFEEYWIEGIGSLTGPLYSGLNIEGGYRELVCCHEEEELIYMNSNYTECYYVATGTVQYDINTLNVYPDYSSNTLDIQSSKIIENILIYDIYGRLLESTAINSTGDIQLDISSLAPGTYLLKVISNNQQDNFKFLKAY